MTYSPELLKGLSNLSFNKSPILSPIFHSGELSLAYYPPPLNISASSEGLQPLTLINEVPTLKSTPKKITCNSKVFSSSPSHSNHSLFADFQKKRSRSCCSICDKVVLEYTVTVQNRKKNKKYHKCTQCNKIICDSCSNLNNNNNNINSNQYNSQKVTKTNITRNTKYFKKTLSICESCLEH
ncbi:hypothetical protein DLAC_06937 [Tieghemostelium lacteum]|uniref:FYVE-type domain-containing protein n=1 Tax=Tieghemostelium lacteum TaxID=361077 RepID=A0A151ZDR4_TIELA|nr:hypothetical protein DLAC_06937 [Tieghemostelium lacteum]|eukprot:KYQ92098.1 hypothetical protein DLAC_06937 [Tieghemostelium lacteum]